MIQMTVGAFWFQFAGLLVVGFGVGVIVGWCLRATRYQGWGS